MRCLEEGRGGAGDTQDNKDGDMLVDARRCRGLRGRDCFTNRLLNQSRINWPATQIVLSLFLEISFTAVDYFR